MLDDEGDGIGADAEIRRMSKRQQASVAEQQVETERGDRRNQTVDHKLQLIGFDKAGHQDQQEEDRHGRGHERYRENERPECFERIVQSWDTANRRPSSAISRCAQLGE
jgi:hypothetical protein